LPNGGEKLRSERIGKKKKKETTSQKGDKKLATQGWDAGKWRPS